MTPHLPGTQHCGGWRQEGWWGLSAASLDPGSGKDPVQRNKTDSDRAGQALDAHTHRDTQREVNKISDLSPRAITLLLVCQLQLPPPTLSHSGCHLCSHQTSPSRCAVSPGQASALQPLRENWEHGSLLGKPVGFQSLLSWASDTISHTVALLSH